MKIAKYLFYINSIIAVLAVFPALLCFGLAIESWFQQPSGCVDCWEFGYSRQEQFLFTSCSLLLVLFYRYVFVNPFLFQRATNNDNSIRNYYLWNAGVNAATLALFISVAGDSYLKWNTDSEAGVLLTVFLWLPNLPFVIAVIGLLKTSRKNAYEKIEILNH